LKQLFNHKDSPRAQTKVDVTFLQLYGIVRSKLDTFDTLVCDPDAFCQQMCVQIERQMGIYPNIEGMEMEAWEKKDAE